MRVVLVGLKAVATSAMVPAFPQVTAAMAPSTTACKEVLREARSGLANHRARKGSQLLVTTTVAPGGRVPVAEQLAQVGRQCPKRRLSARHEIGRRQPSGHVDAANCEGD